MNYVDFDHQELIRQLNKYHSYNDIIRKTGICYATLKRLRDNAQADWKRSTINRLITLYNDTHHIKDVV